MSKKAGALQALRTFYAEQLDKPINNFTVVLECRHGAVFDGNLLAICKFMTSYEPTSDFSFYVVANADSFQSISSLINSEAIPRCKVVKRNTKEYFAVVATAKYLVTDTSFGPFFYKRPEQIYLNTWHGTPLKKMGRQVAEEISRLGNVQRNFICADYLLYPSRYMKNLMLEDYMVEALTSARIIYGGYPRNSILFDEAARRETRHRLGADNKRVYTYLPTYRGKPGEVDSSQNETLLASLHYWDNKLSINEIMYVNLHPFMETLIDWGDYQFIRPFPKEMDGYAVMSASDALVTDYSSVMFDYAATGKKIILFAHDEKEYLASRGLYLDIHDMPFPICTTASATLNELRNPSVQDRSSFIHEYCRYENKDATKQLVDHVFLNRPTLKSETMTPDPNVVLIQAEGMDIAKIPACIRQKYNDDNLTEHRYYITFGKQNSDEQSNALLSLPRNLSFFCTSHTYSFTKSEQRTISKLPHKKSLLKYVKALESAFARERQRRFGTSCFSSIVCFGKLDTFESFFFSSFPSNCTIYDHYSRLLTVGYDNTRGSLLKKCLRDSGVILESPDQLIDSSFGKTQNSKKDRFGFLFPLFLRNTKRGTLAIKGVFISRTTIPYKPEQLHIEINGVEYTPRVKRLVTMRNRSSQLAWLTLTLCKQDLLNCDIQNTIRARIAENGLLQSYRPISYSILQRKAHDSHSPYLNFKDDGVCAFFRQTKGRSIILTVRHRNVTDSLRANIKLNLAWFISRIVPPSQDILVFEKNASKYEESGRRVFEALVDSGQKNIRFVIDRTCASLLTDIEDKYRSKFLYQHTFEHYLSFFRSRKYIGTEGLSHCLELRVQNHHARNKIIDSRNRYVFLQHGVMYMISLNSPSRTFFKRNEINGEYSVVVSSEAEAQHFIDYAGFSQDELIISGLPKFDTSYSLPNADKIIIMPTWRSWEFNEVRHDPESSKYWQMIKSIEKSVPQEYRDKVVIQTHPLFSETEDGKVQQKTSIDELLRHARILITDYSSVAYDAFYRGANVIFYWRELEECLEHYGAGTRLMLNEHNAFGDICYTPEEIGTSITKNYPSPQSEEHLKRYRKIVSYSDNQNTKRLVSNLEKRNFL